MRLYDELADWWPLFSPPEDYAEEAAFYERQLLAFGNAPAETLVEFGSGGGNNAWYLKRRFRTTLVELFPAMIAVSQNLNPDLEHFQGDMRTARLGRQFDRVFIHDAITYMTTLEDLRKAVDTAFAHCRPGGAALFAPDEVRETFQPSTDCGGSDGAGRAIRYLEWCHDPDPSDTVCTVEYVYAMRGPDGSVHVEHDRHFGGLFQRDEWMQTLRDAGFQPHVIPFDHSEEEQTLEVFVGVRPE